MKYGIVSGHSGSMPAGSVVEVFCGVGGLS